MTTKVVTFTKNGLTLEVGLSDTTKVNQLRADGWAPVMERVMRRTTSYSYLNLPEAANEEIIVKNDAQQAAVERFGYVKVSEQDPTV